MQKRRITAKGKERKLKKWEEIEGVSKKKKERSRDDAKSSWKQKVMEKDKGSPE